MSGVLERFPILYHSHALKREAALRGWPVSIPFSLIAPHERTAQSNHYQTLQRLAERGGLSPLEMLAVLTDRGYREVEHMSTGDAIAAIMARGGIGHKRGL